jgi:hypothetical protein
LSRRGRRLFGGGFRAARKEVRLEVDGHCTDADKLIGGQDLLKTYARSVPSPTALVGTLLRRLMPNTGGFTGARQT